MGMVSAHEAQYAGAAVTVVAGVGPRPPRWRGKCARLQCPGVW